MATAEKITRRKLILLRLAQEMNNLGKACRLVAYSRQQFYEIRRNYQTYGRESGSIVCREPEVRIRTG